MVLDIYKQLLCNGCVSVITRQTTHFGVPDLVAICNRKTIVIEVKSSKRSLRLLKDLKEEQKYALTEWEKNGADVYIAIPCDLVGIFPSKKGDCNYAYYVCLEKLDDSLLGMHDAYTLEYIISKMQS